VKTKSRWITVEAAAQELGDVPTSDIEALAEAGELRGVVFPSGLRIDRETLMRLNRAMKRGYVPESVNTLPTADIYVGKWVLPSGRSLQVFIGPAMHGTRKLSTYYDSTAVLSDADRRDLDDRVLPEAASAIARITGKGGVGLIALPFPLGSAEVSAKASEHQVPT
jgi:hypothetical protein